MPPPNTEAWETVEKGEKQPSGKFKITCKNCAAQFIGGGSKVYGHVAGGQVALAANVRQCSRAPRELREKLVKLHDDKLLAKQGRARERALELAAEQELLGDEDGGGAAATSAAPTSAAVPTPGQGAGSSVPVPGSVNRASGRVRVRPSLQRTHTSLTRGLISAGIPFKVLRNKHFREGLMDVAKYGALYVPPSEEGVRAKYAGLVGKEVEERERIFLGANSAIGGTMCDDGWKDCSRNNLLNGTFVCPEGALFVRSKDVTGKTKDARLMFDSIDEMIEKVGRDKVVHVVTDNASVMVAARRLLEEKYPHITCSGCVAHVMDLLLEDLGKLDWVEPYLSAANDVVVFVRNHGDAEAAVKRHGATHELLKPAETRFASKFIMLQRAFQLRGPLRAMATDQQLAAKAALGRTGVHLFTTCARQCWTMTFGNMRKTWWPW